MSLIYTPVKKNYLNNKDILIEIHKSKTSYCSFIDPKFADYDLILSSTDSILSNIESGKIARADRLTKLAQDSAAELEGKKKSAVEVISPDSISELDIIFKIMTWSHIPEGEAAIPKAAKNKKNKIQLDEDSESLLSDLDFSEDIPELALPKSAIKYVKVNFPPFQHFRIVKDANNQNIIECIGKSHWVGDLTTGKFSKDHGMVTKKLALMYMKLCERYSTRSNWRGYCVDAETEALTKRGWLNIDQINEDDTILSYTDEKLAWSSIKSIYRGEFDGLMHHITSRSIDSLITPNHKIVTARGLVEIELLKQNDSVIVMGAPVTAPEDQTFSNSFVELAGWIMTEGCYQFSKGEIKSIQIYQNPTPKADRIRACLVAEGYKFTEAGNKNLCFSLWKESAEQVALIFKNKQLTMDFILKLTYDQRELLINTMIDGDGWRRPGGGLSYCRKDKYHVDLFQALLTLAGKKSNYHYVTDHPSFGKVTNFYSINIFAKRGNKTRGECLDFHGGMNNGGHSNRNKGKAAFPNTPTTPYNGMVWCPETEYGCFVARRNGKVYLTGNTYNDEMRSQALLQLSQVGLQFDESKSSNPFSYFTVVLQNSFTRVLNIEKRNQNIRDDILEINGLNPSYSRMSMSGGSQHHGSSDD